MPLWHHRIPEAGYEHPLVQQRLTHSDRLRCLSQDHRNDGGVPGEWLEPQGQEVLAEVACVLVQAGYELRVALDVLHCREGAARYRGRKGVGKELRPGALGEVVDERGGAGGEATRGA